MIDVHIIDNTGSIRSALAEQGLKLSLFDDEIQALNAAETTKPSIIVLHYGMRQNGTAEFISFLHRASLNSKLLLIAPQLTDDEVIQCLLAGAQGYLQNDQLDQFLNKAIKVINEGEAWISRRLTAQVLERLRSL